MKYLATLLLLLLGCSKPTPQPPPPPVFQYDLDHSQNYCIINGMAFPSWKLRNGGFVCIEPHYAKRVIDEKFPTERTSE